MNRVSKKFTTCAPRQSDMVCSKHFVDGHPTLENPNPTLHLGYERPIKKARRTFIRHLPEPFPSRDDESTITQQAISSGHVAACDRCDDKDVVIEQLTNEVKSLMAQKNFLLAESVKLSEHKDKLRQFTFKDIKSDAKIRFYTGTQTIFSGIVSFDKALLAKNTLLER